MKSIRKNIKEINFKVVSIVTVMALAIVGGIVMNNAKTAHAVGHTTTHEGYTEANQPKSLTLYVKDSSEQPNPNNPIYRTVIPNANIDKEEIKFTGNFENAKLISSEAISDFTYIIFSKSYTTPMINKQGDRFDNAGAIETNHGTYNILDEYIKTPTSQPPSPSNTISPADIDKMTKGAGDLFMAFSKMALDSNFKDTLGAISGTAGTLGIAFTILSFFQTTDSDPVLDKLDEISKQISALDSKIDWKTDEIMNSLDKAQYIEYLRRFATDYTNFKNNWLVPYV
jgi:hypothetical protein